MKKLIILFALIVSVFNKTVAQGEANVWYFGMNAGLNFPFGPPTALTNGMCNTSEGSASIADAAGNLLFYTDGITVWNKLHAVMANGAGLQGNSSSTQSGVIIKKPGSASIYYIFTTAAQAAAAGLRYSEVDMSLAAGNGSVTVKNVLLQTPTCEKITGVRHCNNVDVWVVSHDFNTNAFRTFLVTSAGVNTTPVVSNAGLTPTGAGGNETIGQLKASPDGKKLGSCIWASTQNRFELFDFNNSTGVVSNSILLPQQTASSGAYGCEFSPDGTKFYGTTITPGKIYQWDLCAGSNAAIAASVINIGQSANNFNGSMQLGPDKKIYVARYGVSWVGVINNPNTLGIGCNYVDNGVSLGGKNGSLGLPNFVPYYFKLPPNPFTFTVSCLTASFTPPTVNVTSCSSSTNAVTGYNWNFGDPPSGALNTSTLSNPVHVFTGPGTYTVTLVLGYACGSDTLKQQVVITTPSLAITTTSASCSTPGSATVNVIGGGGPFSYTWMPTAQSTSVATSLTAGLYSVSVSNSAGCLITSTANVGSNNAMTSTLTTSSVTCNGGANGSATVSVGGGSGNYSYLWTPSAQSGSIATNLTAGIYSINVNDLVNPCSVTNTVLISQPNAITLTVVSNTLTACTGSSITLTANGSGGTGAFTYSWTSGPTINTYNVTQTTGGNYTYTVTATDANSCAKSNTVSVSFVTSPSVTATSATICVGQTATLNSGGATTYTWTGGSTGSTFTINPIASTNVTVIGANGSCTAQATASITVNALPQITFTNVDVLCNGQNNGSSAANVTSGTAPFTYTWNTIPAQNTATATGIPAGNYSVIVSDANNCVNTASTQINQPTALTLSINTNTTQTCAGSIINANANAAGGTGPYSYSWSNGPVSANNNITESTAGNYGYTVTLTDANNCSITSNVNLTFHPQPTITATSATVCAGQNALLTASGANNYVWQPGNISGNTYTINAQNQTNVTVTGEANGCSNSTTAMVFVNPLPNVNITASAQNGCVPLCVNYNASSSSNIVNYSWFVNTAGFSSSPNSNYCFNASGTYSINLMVTDNNGCTNYSNLLNTNIYPQPVADFNHAPLKPVINIDGEVHFTDASHGATITNWNWYFMNTAQYTSTQQNPSFLYSEPGTYAVALVVKSDKGCTDTIVRELIVGEDYGLYVPNAFTPNGDGINDIFQPKGFGITKYQLQIFDRWGERIFETKVFDAGWDGKHHRGLDYGQFCEEGVYTWLINVTNVFGKSHELKGHVTLIK